MTKSLVWHLIPRLRDLLFTILFISVFILGSRMLSIDSDLGLHLTTGEYILTSHSIPTSDLFSSTKFGDPRPPYAWLAELFYAIAFRLGDLDGVIWLCALVLAISFTVVYQHSLERSGYPLLALLSTLLAAVTSSIHWLPRPHLFTFLLLAVWLKCLNLNHRANSFPVWAFPLIMLTWANLHAGFIFGVAVWFAYLIGTLYEVHLLRNSHSINELQKLLVIGVLSLAATLLTPGGLDSWRAVLGNTNAYLASHTVETQPPAFSYPGTWIVLVSLLTGSFLMVNKEISPADSLLFAGFGILSLGIARVIPLFVIAAAPILTESMGRRLSAINFWRSLEGRFGALQSRLRGVPWPSVVVVGAILLFMINRSITNQPFNSFNSDIFPVHAVAWLKTNPQSGNMFNNIDWGGYILHRLWPAQKVFIDSRTDFYGEAALRNYEQIVTAAPGWSVLIEHEHVSWVLIRSDAPLVSVLQQAGWQQLYFDPLAVILKKPNLQ